MSLISENFYSEENYTPEESVGYLMRGAWQALLKTIDAEMQILDLTGLQWGPLLLVAKGCCDSVAACARASYTDSGAMTRMLDRLDAATRPEDMNLPGYGFHGLAPKTKGVYAVSVSGNWRITFRFEGGNAVEVNLEDYH